MNLTMPRLLVCVPTKLNGVCIHQKKCIKMLKQREIKAWRRQEGHIICQLAWNPLDYRVAIRRGKKELIYAVQVFERTAVCIC
jgi:hypothetical protein